MKNVLDALNMIRQLHGDFQDHVFEQALHLLLADPSGVVYSACNVGREEVPGSVRGAFDGDDSFTLVGEKHGSERVTLYYAMPGGVVEVGTPREGNRANFSIDAATLDSKAFEVVQGFIKSLLVSEPETGEVKILVQTTMGGFELKSIGLISSELERNNYSAGVLESYDHVVECLGSASPCGRLTILEGPPGTGKSFLIRALIREAKAHYVIVPYMLLGQLSGPTMLPVLLDVKNDEEGGTLPVVLVVEDADAALVNRERGDPSKLSEMLNLGDGLLGELGDLRIVATTNAKRVDIDDAALRPGRLCRHVAVEDLVIIQARSVYERLTGKRPNPLYSEGTSLAKVYSDARDDGWRPRKRDDGSTGQYL